VIGGHVGFGAENVMQGGNDCLFDFGAAEAFGCLCQCVQIESGGVAMTLAEMDGEDISAGGLDRQIDEEDFIESALAEQFRRKGLDVVGGGDEEDGGGVFLHPCQQRSEHPLRESAVGASTCGGGESFFDFVDPEDDRSHHLRLSQCVAKAALGFSDIAVVQGSRVHSQERPLPRGGDGLGAKTLACPLNAEHQNAPRGVDPECGGIFRQSVLSLLEPGLETL